MSDSGALRSRRSRAHARGDHRLCSPDRCAASAVSPRAGPADGGLPEPPVPLADDGARLWYGVLGQYDLAAHERELLGQACQLLDYLALADARLAVGGWVSEGRYGQPRLDPLIEAQFRWRRQFAALIDALHLPDPADEDAVLPTGVTALVPEPERQRHTGHPGG